MNREFTGKRDNSGGAREQRVNKVQAW